MPNGQVQPEFTERLQAMGAWLKKYGATVYGTKGGYLPPQSWGAITQRGNTIYLHVLDNKAEKILLPAPFNVTSLKTFDENQPVKFSKVPDGYIVIDLKGIGLHETNTILVMEKQ
jgi:alpha-L-fucosidase